LFQRGRIPNAKQKRRFLARLRPKIRKLCVIRTFADVEELVGTKRIGRDSIRALEGGAGRGGRRDDDGEASDCFE